MIELINQEYAVQAYGNAMEKKGIKIGEKRGEKNAINRIIRLFSKLHELGKNEDTEKALKDPKYLEKLLKDYGLAED